VARGSIEFCPLRRAGQMRDASQHRQRNGRPLPRDVYPADEQAVRGLNDPDVGVWVRPLRGLVLREACSYELASPILRFHPRERIRIGRGLGPTYDAGMASIYEVRCSRCGWTRTVQDGAFMAGPETWRDPVVCAACHEVFEVPHQESETDPRAECPSCQGPVTRWGDSEGDPVGPCPRCRGEVEIESVLLAD